MKALSVLILLYSTPLLHNAQTLNTFSLTNTNGVYSVLSNPANATASKDWLSINAFGAGLGMENNILHTRFDYSLLQIALLKNYNEKEPAFKPPFFAVKSKAPHKPSFYVNAQVLLPSIKINITKRISVFAYWQERVIGNIIDIGSNVLPLVINKEIPTNYSNSSFNTDVRALAYREVAAGFGAVVYNKREHLFKIGGTFKKITVRFAYIVNTQYFTSNQAFNKVSISSRYRVVATNLAQLTATLTGYALGNNPPGEGFAINMGVSYEHRPNHLKHRYRITNPKGKNKNFRQRGLILYDYKIGVSLLDWGQIDLNNTSVTDKVYEANGSIDLKKLPPPEDYMKELTKNSEVVYENKETRLYMPAKLLLTADYRINYNWFLNIAYSQNLRDSKKAENFYTPSSFSALLRKETEKITFGVPLRIIPLTRTATVGCFTSLGPFFIGTDNVLILVKRKMYNWSIYTGLCFTINYKKDPSIETFKNFGRY